MSDYDQAERTAEQLLHIGALSYREIVQATDLPMWHVKSLAQDVLYERDSSLRYARAILRITRLASESANPPEMISVFTRCMIRIQRLLYHREVTESELSQLTDYASGLGCQRLQSLLLQMHTLSALPDMQLVSYSQILSDSIYAQILRDAHAGEPPAAEPIGDDQAIPEDCDPRL